MIERGQRRLGIKVYKQVFKLASAQNAPGSAVAVVLPGPPLVETMDAIFMSPASASSD